MSGSDSHTSFAPGFPIRGNSRTGYDVDEKFIFSRSPLPPRPKVTKTPIEMKKEQQSEDRVMARLDRVEEKMNELLDMVRYAPGGAVARNCAEDFGSLAGKQDSEFGLTFQWDDRLLAEKAFAGDRCQNPSGASSMEILQIFKASQVQCLNDVLMAAGWTPLQPNFWISSSTRHWNKISILVREIVQFKLMHKIHIFGLTAPPIDLVAAVDPSDQT